MQSGSIGKRLSVVLLGVALSVMWCAACRTTESPRRQLADDAITAQVKSALAKQTGLSSITDIDVSTTNGVVTLSGQVASEDVKHQAEQIARGVSGVVRVNDDLQVQTAGFGR